ncbi:hypothetical protein [Arenibaculum pallidiluteum]|uniref:hypothetical protein n=1 Tax=Arenibaculum pallidiluteum TaxID=2812559 RepID=UPI001A971FE9|nr:hypothetical protein [Arenibaculum pallidiluteum]
MLVHTAKAYAADLRHSRASDRLLGYLLSAASVSGLLLAGILLWIDTGRSATMLLGAVLAGGVALIAHTVSVVLQIERRSEQRVGVPAE